MSGAAYPDFDAMVQAIAARTAELVLAELRASEDSHVIYATAAELAERFRVTAGWVRAHAAELGGTRIGNGQRPRHRFNVALAEDRIAAMTRPTAPRPAEHAQVSPRRRARRTPQTDVPLLPIKAR